MIAEPQIVATRYDLSLFLAEGMDEVFCFLCTKKIKANQIHCITRAFAPPKPTIFYPVCIKCISKSGGYSEAEIGFCNE